MKTENDFFCWREKNCKFNWTFQICESKFLIINSYGKAWLQFKFSGKSNLGVFSQNRSFLGSFYSEIEKKSENSEIYFWWWRWPSGSDPLAHSGSVEPQFFWRNRFPKGRFTLKAKKKVHQKKNSFSSPTFLYEHQLVPVYGPCLSLLDSHSIFTDVAGLQSEKMAKEALKGPDRQDSMCHPTMLIQIAVLFSVVPSR